MRVDELQGLTGALLVGKANSPGDRYQAMEIEVRQLEVATRG
jgi:hypothetical protein